MAILDLRILRLELAVVCCFVGRLVVCMNDGTMKAFKGFALIFGILGFVNMSHFSIRMVYLPNY
jgi:hypothetical protein